MPENTVLNREHFAVHSLVASDTTLHFDFRLLKKVALASTLVSLDITQGLYGTWIGTLFVEPSGFPGYEPIDPDDSFGDFRVPIGTIPDDDDHKGLLYRFHDYRDTWGEPEPNADYDRFQYVNYEGAEDSLAGFFDYDDTDFPTLLACLNAQLEVLNAWAAE